MTVTSTNLDPNLLKALENSLDAKAEDTIKYDMKIGMLVFVKVKTNWDNWSLPTHWYTPVQTIPTIPSQPWQITPNYPSYPGYPYTTTPNSPFNGGGGTYTPHTIPNIGNGIGDAPVNPYGPYGVGEYGYYWNQTAGKGYTLSSTESSAEQDDNFTKVIGTSSSKIKELLSTYQTDFGPKKMGMSMMSSSRKSRRKAEHLVGKQKTNQPTAGVSNNTRSGTHQVSAINGNISTGRITINNGPLNGQGISTHTITTTSTVTINTEYFVHGYKTIKNYFQKNISKVEQKERWAEEDIEKFNQSGFSLAYTGKPFHGIIVDKFVPKMKSEKGEEIGEADLDIPVLYKVLFGEKNLLWVSEEDPLPMKPKDCPRKAI